jgi:Rap1a immunity proteins
MGYLIAVMDALADGAVVNGYRACIPPTADMNQITDVVKNFIRNHPEKRHFLLPSG